jgi:AcrR family transcriptional regulator
MSGCAIQERHDGSNVTMGRRSVHTPEELRELILQSSTELIERGGLSALSAREIARAVGYSPGTIYNVFTNLDDLVLTIEVRMLDALATRLDAAAETASPRERIYRLATAYLGFTHDNPRLWNLLFEHQLPESHQLPQGFLARLEALLAKVEAALAPYFEGKPAEQARAARVLWASVHGITSLSAAGKLVNVTSETATSLVDDLLRAYLAGTELAPAATGT